MANQVTIKKDPSITGTFKASVFNAEGTPVLAPWQEFDLGADMVWDPAEYGAAVTPFYIAKGIAPDADNQFVAYEIHVDFSTATENASITIGYDTLKNPNGGAGCHVFKIVESVGVECQIITTGVPVAGTQLPARCAG